MAENEEQGKYPSSISIEEYDTFLQVQPKIRMPEQTLRWHIAGISDGEDSSVAISYEINFN